MQWPSWLLWRRKSEDKKEESILPKDSIPTPPTAWTTTLNKTDWSHYTTTQTLIFSALTTATTLALLRLYKLHLRRIPSVHYLKPSFFRNRNFYGYVTRVGDGDNFHLFHTPGGKMMGWGWLPRRRVEDMMERAKHKGEEQRQTIHVRIAGVDAPEMAHFGKPAQPYAKEAIEWLRGAVLEREDQYKRVVCSVYKRRWLFFKADVGLNMLKSGLATVYEAKFGSEFGNKEEQYREAEKRAKSRKIGMWQEAGLVKRLLGQSGSFESPRAYKTRTANQEKTAKASDKAKG
ncbi:putative endonuclease lcl3 [Vermiconidia calcicola]|uniref:Endonuclease lcl3 n=1 Tax=Vermiconidia calcicola TaxID=1690605 RepID=A0ACC3NDJ6_9PEZI|nr:putative endonuclease lcl3 [Vermiconidia calcicola]